MPRTSQDDSSGDLLASPMLPGVSNALALLKQQPRFTHCLICVDPSSTKQKQNQMVEQLLSQWEKSKDQNGHGKEKAPQDEIVLHHLTDLVRQRLQGKSDDTVGKTTLKILLACCLSIEVSLRRASTLSHGEQHKYQLAKALAADTRVLRDFDLFHGVEDSHVLGVNLKRCFLDPEAAHTSFLISSTIHGGESSLQPELILVLGDEIASLERRDPVPTQIRFESFPDLVCDGDEIRKNKPKDSTTRHCECSSVYVVDRLKCHDIDAEDHTLDEISVASKKTIEFLGHTVPDLQQHCRYREQPRPALLAKEISRDAYAKRHHHDQALTKDFFCCLSGGTGSGKTAWFREIMGQSPSNECEGPRACPVIARFKQARSLALTPDAYLDAVLFEKGLRCKRETDLSRAEWHRVQIADALVRYMSRLQELDPAAEPATVVFGIDNFGVGLDEESQTALAASVQAFVRDAWNRWNVQNRRAVIVCVNPSVVAWFKPSCNLHLDALAVSLRVHHPERWREQGADLEASQLATVPLHPSCLFKTLELKVVEAEEGQLERWQPAFKRHHYMRKGPSPAAIHLVVKVRSGWHGRQQHARAADCSACARRTEWRDAAWYSFRRAPGGQDKGGKAYREHRLLVLPEFQGLSISSQISDRVGQFLLSKSCQLLTSHKNIKVHWHRERCGGVWNESAKVKDRGPLFPGQAAHDRAEKDAEQHYSGRFIGSKDDQDLFLRWQQKKPRVVAERQRLVDKRQREKDKEEGKSSQQLRREVKEKTRKRRKTQHLKRGGVEWELAHTQSQRSQPGLPEHTLCADAARGKAALAAQLVRAQQHVAELQRQAEATTQATQAEREAAHGQERALRERADAEGGRAEELRLEVLACEEREEKLQRKAGQLIAEKMRLEERVKELERAAGEAQQQAAEERKQRALRERESETEREELAEQVGRAQAAMRAREAAVEGELQEREREQQRLLEGAHAAAAALQRQLGEQASELQQEREQQARMKVLEEGLRGRVGELERALVEAEAAAAEAERQLEEAQRGEAEARDALRQSASELERQEGEAKRVQGLPGGMQAAGEEAREEAREEAATLRAELQATLRELRAARAGAEAAAVQRGEEREAAAEAAEAAVRRVAQLEERVRELEGRGEAEAAAREETERLHGRLAGAEEDGQSAARQLWEEEGARAVLEREEGARGSVEAGLWQVGGGRLENLQEEGPRRQGRCSTPPPAQAGRNAAAGAAQGGSRCGGSELQDGSVARLSGQGPAQTELIDLMVQGGSDCVVLETAHAAPGSVEMGPNPSFRGARDQLQACQGQDTANRDQRGAIAPAPSAVPAASAADASPQRSPIKLRAMTGKDKEPLKAYPGVPSSRGLSGDHILRFSKFKGYWASYIAAMRPNYCRWAVREKNPNGPLSTFVDFLREHYGYS